VISFLKEKLRLNLSRSLNYLKGTGNEEAFYIISKCSAISLK